MCEGVRGTLGLNILAVKEKEEGGLRQEVKPMRGTPGRNEIFRSGRGRVGAVLRLQVHICASRFESLRLRFDAFVFRVAAFRPLRFVRWTNELILFACCFRCCFVKFVLLTGEIRPASKAKNGAAQWLACWAQNPQVRGWKPRFVMKVLKMR